MRIEIADYVTWYEKDDAVVAIDRRTKARTGLAEASALLWKRAAAGDSIEKLTVYAAQAYSVSRDDAEDLVNAFADAMAQKQLVWILGGAR